MAENKSKFLGLFDKTGHEPHGVFDAIGKGISAIFRGTRNAIYNLVKPLAIDRVALPIVKHTRNAIKTTLSEGKKTIRFVEKWTLYDTIGFGHLGIGAGISDFDADTSHWWESGQEIGPDGGTRTDTFTKKDIPLKGDLIVGKGGFIPNFDMVDAITKKRYLENTPIPEGTRIHAGTIVPRRSFVGSGIRMIKPTRGELSTQTVNEITHETKVGKGADLKSIKRFAREHIIETESCQPYTLPFDLKIGQNTAPWTGDWLRLTNGRVIGPNNPTNIIRAGETIPQGTRLPNNFIIPVNSEVLEVKEVETIPTGRLSQTIRLTHDYTTQAEIRVSAPITGGIKTRFWDRATQGFINETGNIYPGAIIPAGTKLLAGTVMPVGSESAEEREISEAEINSDAPEGIIVNENYRTPAPWRLNEETILRRAIYAGEFGILIPQNANLPENPSASGKKYEFEPKASYDFKTHKFQAKGETYKRIKPNVKIEAGTRLPVGTIILGGAKLERHQGLEKLPTHYLESDVALAQPEALQVDWRIGAPINAPFDFIDPITKKFHPTGSRLEKNVIIPHYQYTDLNGIYPPAILITNTFDAGFIMPGGSEGVDVAKKDIVKHVTSNKPPKDTTPEAIEVLELKLTVAGPCNTTDTDYVGLSPVQRDKLGVKEGDIVELFDSSDKSLGRAFRVGKGSKEFLENPEVFTANGVSENTTVTIKKINNLEGKKFYYDVAYNAENSPNNEKRKQIIANRLKINPEIYITVPEALVGKQIKTGKIQYNGALKEIAIVPAGDKIGFTTEAAKHCGIPTGSKKVNVKIENDVIVIS